MNTSKSTISKKHLIAIAVVLALGVGAGAFILQGGGKPKVAVIGDHLDFRKIFLDEYRRVNILSEKDK